jgi:hypothetical protein
MFVTVTNMNATCQKQDHLFLLDNVQGSSFDTSASLSPQITISEKEYFTLKCEVGYWRSMHEKSLSKIDQLNLKIKHQKGRIRDLTKRLFGKKSEKKNSRKKTEKQITVNQEKNVTAASNKVAKGMDALNALTYLVLRNL